MSPTQTPRLRSLRGFQSMSISEVVFALRALVESGLLSILRFMVNSVSLWNNCILKVGVLRTSRMREDTNLAYDGCYCAGQQLFDLDACNFSNMNS